MYMLLRVCIFFGEYMHMLYNSINIAVSMLIGGILMAYNEVGKAATNKYRARFDMI